jgi:hypothetical protein
MSKLAVRTNAEEGCLEGAKEGYAAGLTENKGDVVPGPPAKGLFN